MSKVRSSKSVQVVNKRKATPAPQHRGPGAYPSHTNTHENPDKIDYIPSPGRCGIYDHVPKLGNVSRR
jgi:hypothetical protein